jgi:hypothetical protein
MLELRENTAMNTVRKSLQAHDDINLVDLMQEEKWRSR